MTLHFAWPRWIGSPFFYQMHLHASSSALRCAAAWNPTSGVGMFQPLRVGFGGSGAPYQFRRVSHTNLQAISDLFCVSAVPHTDDYAFLETVEAMPSARQSVVLKMSVLGLDLGEEKAVPPRCSGGSMAEHIQSIGTGATAGVALGLLQAHARTAEFLLGSSFQTTRLQRTTSG